MAEIINEEVEQSNAEEIINEEIKLNSAEKNRSAVEYVSEAIEFRGLDAPVIGKSQTMGWCRGNEKEAN